MGIKLGFGVNFQNLYQVEELEKLDNLFLQFLQSKDEILYQYLVINRETYQDFSIEYGQKDNEIISIAEYLEEFLLELFPIASNYQQLKNKVSQESKVFLFRKLFTNKYVKTIDYDSLKDLSFKELKDSAYKLLNIDSFNEEVIINQVLSWLENKEENKENLEIISKFLACIFFDEERLEQYNTKLFFKAKKYDFLNLIPLKNKDEITQVLNSKKKIIRDDFSLYKKSSLYESLHNSNYCVKCHSRGKDSCRVGEVKEKYYQKNPLDVKLEGCPLGMHISQMHSLNEKNSLIAALCVITINNPLCAATGNNICYDCVTSCIFQKQERVNTPLVETHILQEVLQLPWGFEIYNLLTLWNPLRVYRPHPKAYIGKNMLVVGAGPAGYSLAYNMLNEGFGVILVDALKIEPLDFNIKEPILAIGETLENLDIRVIAGFGGVSEYGITARWDKNYLKILRIILERQSNFYLQGGIKFGGNLTTEIAEKFNLKHIALCVGAGDPSLPQIKDVAINGIKTASEFLMTLHLGALKKDLINAMEIRLPLVVLGAGLTALDVATEALLYYRVQVEKFIGIYNDLLFKIPQKDINKALTAEEIEVLEEYLDFYKLMQEVKNNESINLIEEIYKRGGVKIIYHRKIEDSKAYKNNYEELQSAMKQGIEFIGDMSLIKINFDDHNKLTSLDFKNQESQEIVNIKAHNLILALGTKPNVSFMENMSQLFNKEDAKLNPLQEKAFEYKDKTTSLLFKKLKNDVYISLLGDMHQIFKGSVVKAIASSLYGYRSIKESIIAIQENEIYTGSFKKLKQEFKNYFATKIVSSKALRKNLVEVIVENDSIFDSFKGGMFLKLQNYESQARHKKSTIMEFKKTIEPLFLTGLKDNQNKTIKLLILNSGLSSKLISQSLVEKKGDILLMGPLGSASKIAKNKNLLLIGGGVANLTTMSVLEEAKAMGNKIVYLGGFKAEEDIFYLDFLKKHCDSLILSVEKIKKNMEKKQDNITYIKGNIIDGIKFFIKQTQKQNDFTFNFNNTEEILLAGSATMMNVVKEFLLNQKREHQVNENFYVSVNAYMQCGMGGVCGSCMQKKIIDGKEVIIYACKKQDQLAKVVDLENLQTRLKQNSLQEKLLKLWFSKV